MHWNATTPTHSADQAMRLCAVIPIYHCVYNIVALNGRYNIPYRSSAVHLRLFGIFGELKIKISVHLDSDTFTVWSWLIRVSVQS